MVEFNSRVLLAKFGINLIDILEYTIKKKLQEVLYKYGGFYFLRILNLNY